MVKPNPPGVLGQVVYLIILYFVATAIALWLKEKAIINNSQLTVALSLLALFFSWDMLRMAIQDVKRVGKGEKKKGEEPETAGE